MLVEQWGSRIMHLKYWVPTIAVCLVYGFVYSWAKLGVALLGTGTILMVIGGSMYFVDRNIFILCRLHRILMTDDSLVAMLLILVIVTVGVAFTTLFAVFTIYDVRDLFHSTSNLIEANILRSSFSQELWRDLSNHSTTVLDEWLTSFEDSYVTNTTWQPVFKMAVEYLEKSGSTGNATSCASNSVKSMWECSITEENHNPSFWDHFEIPDWDAIEGTFNFLRQQGNLQEKVRDVVLRAGDSAINVTFFLLSIIFFVVDFGIRVGFFFTILFLLLSSKINLMHDVLTGFFVMPGSNEELELDIRKPYIFNLERQLRSTMEAVFTLPVKMAFYHAVITFVVFKALDISFMFLASSTSIVLTIFPFILPYFVCLPWVVFHFANSRYDIGIGLLVSHVFLYTTVDTWIISAFRRKVQSTGGQEMDQSKNEYMTGISIFFGVTAFGMHGIIVGPLLVCLGLVTFNTLRDQQRDVAVESNRRVSVPGSPKKSNLPKETIETRRRSGSSTSCSESKTPPNFLGSLFGAAAAAINTGGGSSVPKRHLSFRNSERALSFRSDQGKTTSSKLEMAKYYLDNKLITEEEFSDIRKVVIDSLKN